MEFTRRALALAAASLALHGQTARAQGDTRPYRFIVQSPPGSTPDIGARIAAQFMAGPLKAPIVVENKPGANGVVAIGEVLKSPADGHTLMIAPSGTMALSPHVYRGAAGKALTDFVAAGELYLADFCLVTRADGDLASVADVLQRARTPGSSMTAAYSAPGNISHAALELFKNDTKTDIYSVSFNSSPAACLAVASGLADLLFETFASTDALVRAGKLRRIAVTGSQRSQMAPALPTVQEEGVPGYAVTAWGAMFLARATPAAQVRLVGDAMVEALKNPEMTRALRTAGLFPGNVSPAQFNDVWRAEAEQWRQTVAQSPSLRIGVD